MRRANPKSSVSFDYHHVSMTAHTNIPQSPSLPHSRPKAHQAYSGQRKSALATLRRFLRSRSRKADVILTRAWGWAKSRLEATLRSRTLCSRSPLRRRSRTASWNLGARRSWWRYPGRSNCLLCRRTRCAYQVKMKITTSSNLASYGM